MSRLPQTLKPLRNVLDCRSHVSIFDDRGDALIEDPLFGKALEKVLVPRSCWRGWGCPEGAPLVAVDLRVREREPDGQLSPPRWRDILIALDVARRAVAIGSRIKEILCRGGAGSLVLLGSETLCEAWASGRVLRKHPHCLAALVVCWDFAETRVVDLALAFWPVVGLADSTLSDDAILQAALFPDRPTPALAGGATWFAACHRGLGRLAPASNDWAPPRGVQVAHHLGAKLLLGIKPSPRRTSTRADAATLTQVTDVAPMLCASEPCVAQVSVREAASMAAEDAEAEALVHYANYVSAMNRAKKRRLEAAEAEAELQAEVVAKAVSEAGASPERDAAIVTPVASEAEGSDQVANPLLHYTGICPKCGREATWDRKSQQRRDGSSYYLVKCRRCKKQSHPEEWRPRERVRRRFEQGEGAQE